MSEQNQESINAQDNKAAKAWMLIMWPSVVLAFAQLGIVGANIEPIADLIGVEDSTVKTATLSAFVAIMFGGIFYSGAVAERISPGFSDRNPSSHD